MEINIFIKGFIVGCIIGIPIGPLGAIGIQRVIVQGRIYGFISGFGSAMADLLYGCIAAFGLTFISDFLLGHKETIQISGGILICLIGVKVFFSKPALSNGNADKKGIVRTFASSFVLSATNPATIVAFAAFLTGFGLPTHRSYLTSLLLVLGIFLGAFFWWIVLTCGISFIRNNLAVENIKRMNKIFGILIIIISLFVILPEVFDIWSK